MMVNNNEPQPITKYKLRELGKRPLRLSKQTVPSREQLREIFYYGGILSKSIFLFMSSS